ncbi:hypothetical protein PVAP13_5KG588400 [Panicum virgatum]|uniref:F-box domain-containing protein n=1 Tax=Panicum virgatum TaxID=38727 RepID=A0A8T0SZ27_PANVG|nr:hypothetical protein PVAP13_5KG588400 [Panicum virgatum]
MAANRCLSDLPDDLLRHILSFAPAKEAAATAVISRRWRALWRTCGAVNLDSRSYGRRLNNAETRGDFFRGAEAALAAARAPLRKLTLYVELELKDRPEPETLLPRPGTATAKQELSGMIGALLSKPAARRVEELCIGAQMFGGVSLDALTGYGFRELRFGAHHPWEALRVLHVTNCLKFTPAPLGTPFPRLAEMRLRLCGVSRTELQAMIDAAPLLATLHLESVSLSTDEERRAPFKAVQCYQLRCPAVTALVLENCPCPLSVQDGIKLDVPRLRYLSFKGFVALERLSLKSHAPFLDRVDLHFLDKVYGLLTDEDNVNVLLSEVRTPFWQFLRNFDNAKALKLKLGYPIDHIAVAGEELGGILGGKMFSKLERLELEGTYVATREAPGFAIANLLHCCPVVRDLRLKLSKMRPRLGASDLRPFAKLRAQTDFDESVDHFKHRRILPDGDGDDSEEEVSDIGGLREQSFNCMRKHLRRVSLEFRMEEPNCFAARLAKFFAENAAVLDEMYIDDGNHRIREHLSGKVGRWTRNSSESRRIPSSVLAQPECGDRLSRFSDGVLGHILSFLPAFQAAQATMLSRRWRHIFGAVHTISMDGWERPIPSIAETWPWPPMPFERAPFGNVVSAALHGRRRCGGAGAPLRKLRIALRDFCGLNLNPGMVDQWLSCAMQLAGGQFHLDLGLGGSLVCSLARRRSSDPEDKDKPYAGPHATCGGERDDDDEEDEEYPALPLADDDDAAPRAIPVPGRLFSFLTLRSLRLGPCRLDLPAAIHLPSLDTLLLTRVVGPGAGAQIQRLVTACPRLADLTLEACAKLTTLSVRGKRLRRLALLCCHKLAAVAVDASELRSFEYRGVVPAPSFLTVHGAPPRISSCALDFCGDGEEPTDPSKLRDFLQLFACARHVRFKSAQLGAGVGNDGVSPSPPAFPALASLRRLELTGLCPRDDATAVAALTRILGQTPSLETLSLFFLPEPLKAACSSHGTCCDGESTLATHRLRYDRHADLAVPDGGEIPCMKQRVKEINLVHYQGGVSQRTLAKFLLRNAPAVEELCCVFAPGPLWMQTKLAEEMRGWVMYMSTKLTFL